MDGPASYVSHQVRVIIQRIVMMIVMIRQHHEDDGDYLDDDHDVDDHHDNGFGLTKSAEILVGQVIVIGDEDNVN